MLGLVWLKRCINNIDARACIMDSEANSPVDWSLLLRNIGHTILMLVWRYRSYFTDRGKIQIKTWQVKFATVVVRRDGGRKKSWGLRKKKKRGFKSKSMRKTGIRLHLIVCLSGVRPCKDAIIGRGQEIWAVGSVPLGRWLGHTEPWYLKGL